MTRAILLLVFLAAGPRLGLSTSLCHLTTASEPQTSLLRQGCTVISAGRPSAEEDSLARRASELQMEWVHIHAGFNNSNSRTICETPAGCEKRGKTQYVATEVGVPGHAYEDVVRAAQYARASSIPRCGLDIASVWRTHPRHLAAASWPAWHFKQLFGPKLAAKDAIVVSRKFPKMFWQFAPPPNRLSDTCIITPTNFDCRTISHAARQAVGTYSKMYQVCYTTT